MTGQESQPDQDRPASGARLLAVFVTALVAVPFVLRLRLLRIRGFNPDEFEHLHASWCLAQGLVPYRDFFEHHTPGLYVLLAPLFGRYDVGGEAGDAWAFLFLARGLMWVAAAIVLVLTWTLGRRVAGARAAWLAVLFLANAGIFLGKTIEVRPDVPALGLLLASVLAATAAVDDGGATRRRAVPWVASGALLGLAVLFTQKVLFAAPGLLLAPLLARGGEGRPAARRLAAAAWMAAGFALPLLLTLLAFVRWQAAGPFLADNFLLNARWKTRLGPGGLVRELLVQDTALLLLGAAGLVAAWRALGRLSRLGPLVLAASSLVAGLWVMPVVHRQYGLLALPLWAVLAAWLAAGWWDRFFPAERSRSGPAVLAVLLAGLSVQPLMRFAASFGRTNNGDLEAIRFVTRNVGPGETVLDGFSGAGLFKRHAFDPFFLHDEIRAMLDEGARTRLAEDLRSGRALPKVVLLDRHLRDFSPMVTAFLEAHYVPLGPDPVRVRLYDNGLGWWRDEGWRHLVDPGEGGAPSPQVYVGEGWQRGESGPEHRFRRARGARSQVLVPVRDPGGFVLTVRAGLLAGGEPVGMGVSVNRTVLGQTALGPGWNEYRFTVAEGVARAGLNDVLLAWWGRSPDEPADGRPVAVEAIALTRGAGRAP